MRDVMGMNMRRVSLGLLAVVALSGNAWGWEDTGHKIVCEIAFRLVKPTTRAEIGKLIQIDPEFASFSDACTWPDRPKRRARDHFVNVPRNAEGLTSEACPLAESCILTAIANDLAVLSSASTPAVDQLAALKFLGHWLGDIHEPLHVSFVDDRGGNNIAVSGECQGVLHAAWDNCLLLKAIGEDVSAAAGSLIGSMTPAMSEQWTATQPRDWANESFALAKDARTGYCTQQAGSCALTAGAVTIDAAYVEASTTVIREQLQKAGVRLAHLLDAALGN
jgi:hypothetical protein